MLVIRLIDTYVILHELWRGTPGRIDKKFCSSYCSVSLPAESQPAQQPV